MYCEKQEADSLVLIHNKLTCTKQALRPDALPKDVSAAEAKIFYSKAAQNYANALWLQSEWWDSARAKYKLPADENIYVDFQSCEFFYYK